MTTKNTYDLSKHYLQVLFDPIDLCDFELNESQQIVVGFLRSMMKAQYDKVCFGDGLKVATHASNNTLTITAGVATLDGYIYELTANSTVSLAEPPGADTRTDVIYARLSITTITAVEDPAIMDDTLAKQTARRSKLNVEFLSGAAVPADDATYTHLGLASITRRAGVVVVDAADIADTRVVAETNALIKEHFNDYIRQPGYGVTSGISTAYTLTLTPAPTSYTENMGIVVKMHTACGDSPTMNINGLGAVALLKPDGTAYAADDLKQNYYYEFRFDGTNLRAASAPMEGDPIYITDEEIGDPIPLNADTLGNQLPSYYATQGDMTTVQSDLSLFIATKGQTSGLAELDSSGKVPSTQLPAYVDDVLEYADFASLPAEGETGKIYVTIDDGVTYRWSGTQYVEISSSLALGETSATAYRGDRGKTAYDHSQVSGASHGAVSAATASTMMVRDASGRAKVVDASATDDIATLMNILKKLGSENTTGTADWNDVSNRQPGVSPTLLLGNATNGPGPEAYFFCFCLEHITKNGTGDLIQLAFPYSNATTLGIFMRGYYNSAWTAWYGIGGQLPVYSGADPTNPPVGYMWFRTDV